MLTEECLAGNVARGLLRAPACAVLPAPGPLQGGTLSPGTGLLYIQGCFPAPGPHHPLSLHSMCQRCGSVTSGHRREQGRHSGYCRRSIPLSPARMCEGGSGLPLHLDQGFVQPVCCEGSVGVQLLEMPHPPAPLTLRTRSAWCGMVTHMWAAQSGGQ